MHTHALGFWLHASCALVAKQFSQVYACVGFDIYFHYYLGATLPTHRDIIGASFSLYST